MKFKTLLLTLLLGISSVAFSAGVMKEMFKMKQQMNLLVQAESADAFHQAAESFLIQAEEAKKATPASLDGEDAERLKGYQAGMQDVIDVVKQADSLAQQGKLEEAKATISQLDAMKKKYHQEYK